MQVGVSAGDMNERRYRSCHAQCAIYLYYCYLAPHSTAVLYKAAMQAYTQWGVSFSIQPEVLVLRGLCLCRSPLRQTHSLAPSLGSPL